MPAPKTTIKIQLHPGLKQRVEALSRYLDVPPDKFIAYAVEEELGRQERDLGQEQRLLEEVRRKVLATGQSVSLSDPDEAAEHDTCAFCLRVIPRGPRFDGPVLCDSCFALAQGIRLPASSRAF